MVVRIFVLCPDVPAHRDDGVQEDGSVHERSPCLSDLSRRETVCKSQSRAASKQSLPSGNVRAWEMICNFSIEDALFVF